MTERIRATCLRKGHKVRRLKGVPLPFDFCYRFWCDYGQVSQTYPMQADRRKGFADAADRANARASQRVVGFSWPQTLLLLAFLLLCVLVGAWADGGWA